MVPDGKWQCGNAVCHGGGNAPFIDTKEAGAAYTSLQQVTVSGLPYIPNEAGVTDPNASSIICNLQGGCETKMPEAPAVDPTNDELCMIQAWLKCGAPR